MIGVRCDSGTRFLHFRGRDRLQVCRADLRLGLDSEGESNRPMERSTHSPVTDSLARGGRPVPGAIDCDIHAVLPNTRALLPYFDPYWREHVQRRGLERDSFEASSYPANAPLNRRPDWVTAEGPAGSSLAALQTHVL